MTAAKKYGKVFVIMIFGDKRLKSGEDEPDFRFGRRKFFFFGAILAARPAEPVKPKPPVVTLDSQFKFYPGDTIAFSCAGTVSPAPHSFRWNSVKRRYEFATRISSWESPSSPVWTISCIDHKKGVVTLT